LPSNIEDERAWVALGGERAGLLVVVIVIDGEFDGLDLDAKVVAKVGLEAGVTVASDREVAGVAVLYDDKAGLAVVVETVRNSQELARDTIVDPEELAIADSWATWT
jgi:hypothetical protein